VAQILNAESSRVVIHESAVIVGAYKLYSNSTITAGRASYGSSSLCSRRPGLRMTTSAGRTYGSA
jgi:hypothetical protein